MISLCRGPGCVESRRCCAVRRVGRAFGAHAALALRCARCAALRCAARAARATQHRTSATLARPPVRGPQRCYSTASVAKWCRAPPARTPVQCCAVLLPATCAPGSDCCAAHKCVVCASRCARAVCAWAPGCRPRVSRVGGAAPCAGRWAASVLCCAVLCCATPRCAVLCCATPRCAVLIAPLGVQCGVGCACVVACSRGDMAHARYGTATSNHA